MAVRQMLSATATTTTEVKLAPQVRKKLLTQLREYQGLKAQRDAIDAAMNATKAAIGTIRTATGMKALEIDGFKVKLVEPTRRTLNHKKLIAAGCAQAWIDEATEEKPTKTYEKVTCPGDAEKEWD